MYQYPDYNLEPLEESEQAVLYCSVCCASIYSGEAYHNIDGDVWCGECMSEYVNRTKHTA